MENPSRKGYWEYLKEQIHDQWSRLSYDELDEIRGKWKLLSDKLIEHYGWTKAEAQKRVHEFLKKHDLTGNGHDGIHIHEVYQHSKEKLKDAMEYAIENPEDVIGQVNHYLKEHPWVTIGLSMLATATVVTLLSNLSHRKEE